MLGSTLREFDVILQAVETHGASLKNQFIRILTDNMGLVYAIRKQDSKTVPVRDRLIKLYAFMANLNSSIIVQHIKGAQNIVADMVSRIDIGDSFMLNPIMFKAINK